MTLGVMRRIGAGRLICAVNRESCHYYLLGKGGEVTRIAESGKRICERAIVPNGSPERIYLQAGGSVKYDGSKFAYEP